MHIYILFCMYDFCWHTCTCSKCPKWPEEGIRYPGTRIADGVEWPCWCWKQSTYPLGKKSELLTISEIHILQSHMLDMLVCFVLSRLDLNIESPIVRNISLSDHMSLLKSSTVKGAVVLLSLSPDVGFPSLCCDYY